MSRGKIYYYRISVIIFFTVYISYFIIFNRYHLFYLEQVQLFRYDKNYIDNFLLRPGGPSEIIGAFLTQFFLFPFAGASIVSLGGVAVYLTTNVIFRRYQINGILWSFIPVVLLAALSSHHLYKMAYTIGFIVSLGYFSIYISIRNNKIRYFFLFISFPLLYFISGGYALHMILLGIVHELFFCHGRSRFLATLMLLLLSCLVPYLASRLIFYIKTSIAWTCAFPLFEARTKFISVILLAYYPVMLVVSKWLTSTMKNKLLSPCWNWKTIIAGALVLMCMMYWVMKYVYDRKTEIILGMDHYVQVSNWNKVLKLSNSYQGNNRLVLYFTNLALYKTGQLGNKMFHYPQIGIKGLWLDWKRDEVAPFFGGELYYQLAYNSEAYRWAFEALVAIGPNPRSLKRLAITSFVNGDIALAEKYLKVLNQSIFYRKWAQHYLYYINHPGFIKEDKELNEKCHFKIDKDIIVSGDNFDIRLPQLLESHPDNHMAFEYLMASMLLEKNINGFITNIYRLKELNYKSIPVHYQEALIQYASYTTPGIFDISATTFSRFSDYSKMVLSIDAAPDKTIKAIYNKYGKTYWFYHDFINSQSK